MQRMSDEASRHMLREARFGHLAALRGDGAYALPLFFGYDGTAVYFHCHPGEKDEAFASTKTACFVATRFRNEDEWATVRVFGHLERLSVNDDIQAAKAALLDVPYPPQWGTLPGGKPARSDQHMYYLRLRPERVEGVESHRG